MAEEKKLKNQKVKLEYTNSAGEVTKNIGEAYGCIIAVNGNEPLRVNFADMPADIQRGAMAFGFNTRFRNEVNTAANIEEGFNGLVETIDGFNAGNWRAGGSGGTGTPVIIEALIRATTEAGVHTEEKEALWRETYGELDAKGKAKQTDEWLKKGPVKAAYNTIKEEKAKAALERVKAAKKAMKASGEETDNDLGDL